MSVYDYFQDKLGVAPHETTLRDLPVKSNCGRECVKVIDEGAAELAEYPDRRKQIIDGVNEAVEVLWLG